MANQLRRDNHYVPQLYLRSFADSDGNVAAYRILVSNPKVPEWRRASVRGLAYHSYLYTRAVAAGWADDLEKWLAREFEVPYGGVIRKVLSDSRLIREDWRILARFAMAQQFRTPATMMTVLRRAQQTAPGILQDTLDGLATLTSTDLKSIPVDRRTELNTQGFPLRVSVQRPPGQAGGLVSAEMSIGRAFWHWTMRHILTSTIERVPEHRWTILEPPCGTSWPTSDNPTIALNYYRDDQFNLEGGWANPGGEILLPLSPRHLLYAKVGDTPPRRGVTVGPTMAANLRRVIVSNAHRMVFSNAEDPEVPRLRPRTIDLQAFVSEREQWQKWHDEQTESERQFLGST